MADIQPSASSTDVAPDEMDPGPTTAGDPVTQEAVAPDNNPAHDNEAAAGDDLDAMDVQPDIADDSGDDMLLPENDQAAGKRVKVCCPHCSRLTL